MKKGSAHTKKLAAYPLKWWRGCTVVTGLKSRPLSLYSLLYKTGRYTIFPHVEGMTSTFNIFFGWGGA